jgi:hypothetical protein
MNGVVESYSYIRNDNPEGRKYIKVITGLKPSKTFLKNSVISKPRKKYYCRICEKSKRSRYIGGRYSKICLDCMDKILSKSIDNLEEWKMLLKSQLNELKLNKEKWKREETINNLKWD